MNITIDTIDRQGINKLQHLFMIKTQQTRTTKKFLLPNKGHYGNPQ